MTKVCLVDLDDTLWATHHNNRESLEEVYTALGWGQYFSSFDEFFDVYYPINVALWSEYNRGLIGKKTLSRERLRRPLEPFLRLSDEEADRIDGDFLALVRQKTTLCPGALPLMEHLHASYRVCILSNGFGSVQYDKIERSGLSPYVDEVVLSDEVGVQKPDPAIFALALERTGGTPSQAVMIGDSWESDIVGASRAGIRSIWYNPYGFSAPEMGEGQTPPWHIAKDLLEIRQWL